MSESYRMVQCSLKRGNSHQITWLPLRFAIKGKILEINHDGEWENGWVVEEVYSGKIMDLDKVKISALQYRDTRKASDI